MKKILLTAFALAAIASCTKTNEPGPVPGTDTPVEIKLTAGITATVKAPVVQGNEIPGVQFVKQDGAAADWTAVSAVTTAGKIAANNAIAFTTPQYYPSDGSKTNLVAFYPAATSLTGGVATMTITGDEDVLYARPVSGDKAEANQIKSMTFDHQLTQFNIILKRDNASTSADITEAVVTLKNANTTFTLALADGTQNWTGSTTGDIIMVNKDVTAGTTASSPKTFMLQPDQASLVLTVSATGYAGKEVTINAPASEGKFSKGKAYNVTLTFKGTEIAPSAAITAWITGDPVGGDIQ